MIDATGTRANETGWTPEAIKADRKAKRAAAKAAKKAKGKASRAAAWDFFLRNLLVWLAIAGLVATSSWEWVNTSRGWAYLYPGLHPIVPPIGAVGAIILFFFAFRQDRENSRAADFWEETDEKKSRARRKDSYIWRSVTLAAYLVCVAGVFIATATAAEKAQRVAKESRRAFNELVVKRNEMATRVELNNPEILQLQLDSDKRTLKALESTARDTHGLPDLQMREDGDPADKHGCPPPPKKFMASRLCIQANGGIDPFNGEVIQGLRTEVEKDELALKNAQGFADKLAELEKQIKNFPAIQGDETADAVGNMVSGNGGSALGWILLVLSSLFLYAGGWLGDWVFERIERIREATRAAKGA